MGSKSRLASCQKKSALYGSWNKVYPFILPPYLDCCRCEALFAALWLDVSWSAGVLPPDESHPRVLAAAAVGGAVAAHGQVQTASDGGLVAAGDVLAAHLKRTIKFLF